MTFHYAPTWGVELQPADYRSASRRSRFPGPSISDPAFQVAATSGKDRAPLQPQQNSLAQDDMETTHARPAAPTHSAYATVLGAGWHACGLFNLFTSRRMT